MKRASKLLSAMITCATLAAAPSFADWTTVHRDATNNAVVPINATLTDLTAAPTWTTGPAKLNTGARALPFGGRVYAVQFDSTGNTIKIVGYNRQTGAQEFITSALDVGNSLSFGSLSAPSIDSATNSAYYGSGVSMQRIDLTAVTPATSVAWSTALSATNTSATGEYDIINSSPAIGDGRVFIKTYLGFLSTKKTQIVAFNQATGAVDWFHETGGPGNASPLFIEAGATDFVIVDASDSSGNGGMACYNAVTGALLWNHATVAVPWNVGTTGFYGDFVYSGGKVYAFSYDFTANGKLAIVDPANGAATIVNAIGTDSVPVVAGSTVYGIGGAYGDADIRGYNALTGAETFSTDVYGGNQYIFRNYLVALNDSLYCATDNGFNSAPNTYLLRLNPANGAEIGHSTAATNYTGAVTVDDDGAVFAYRQDGSLNGLAVPVSAGVSDWMNIEW